MGLTEQRQNSQNFLTLKTPSVCLICNLRELAETSCSALLSLFDLTVLHFLEVQGRKVLLQAFLLCSHFHGKLWGDKVQVSEFVRGPSNPKGDGSVLL